MCSLLIKNFHLYYSGFNDGLGFCRIGKIIYVVLFALKYFVDKKLMPLPVAEVISFASTFGIAAGELLSLVIL
jgi:hypothetical protein